MSKTSKLVLAAVVAAVVVIGGCNMLMKKAGEKLVEGMIESASDGKADVDMKGDGSMTITTDEGTMTTGNSLPAGWPTDIPMAAGAAVQFSGAANGMMGADGMAVVMTSEDSTADVAAFYKTALASEGWTVKSTMEAQGSTIYLAEKAGRTISVTVTGASGKTTITIGVQDGE